MCYLNQPQSTLYFSASSSVTPMQFTFHLWIWNYPHILSYFLSCFPEDGDDHEEAKETIIYYASLCCLLIRVALFFWDLHLRICEMGMTIFIPFFRTAFGWWSCVCSWIAFIFIYQTSAKSATFIRFSFRQSFKLFSKGLLDLGFSLLN